MKPSPAHTVLLAGASGLIGRALLAQLAADTDVQQVHALGRRAGSVPSTGPHIATLVVDYAALPALPRADEAYCALGTTIGQAGSQAAFRRVDVDAVVHFARAAQAAGVRGLAVVSALGADARSPVFYNRIKGEMETALGALGFERLVIARPSLLIGDRAALGQPQRLGERLAIAATRPIAGLMPARWRPIQAAAVAQAMVHALRLAGTGVRVLESAELHALGHPGGA
jgi:uncharacterized protein YbjT (DUF2867 family)